LKMAQAVGVREVVSKPINFRAFAGCVEADLRLTLRQLAAGIGKLHLERKAELVGPFDGALLLSLHSS